MKLFDLTTVEKKALTRFVVWHLAYVGYVSMFTLVIYHYHLFKAYWFLKESWILNLVSPAHTILFIMIGPYRADWIRAIKNMYQTLEGDLIFCLMALLVLVVGFYLYNALIWGAGSLIPSILFT